MNIFYSEVDLQLQLELDARAAAGTKNRSERDLDFMVGKIANVEISAFAGENAQTPILQTLGGFNVRQGRYLPSGPAGYLNETPYLQKSIEYSEKDQSAFTRTDKLTDASYRTGPFITTTTITIGDHSMGLLNKAVVNILKAFFLSRPGQFNQDFRNFISSKYFFLSIRLFEYQ